MIWVLRLVTEIIIHGDVDMFLFQEFVLDDPE